MNPEKILILDFGSQYTQLIARRIREFNIYCEIYPYNKMPEFTNQLKGVILSGSPFSVNESNAPIVDLGRIKGKIPLLGVCYGAQYIANSLGGKVLPSKIREYGRANLSYIDTKNILLQNVSEDSQVWMSHGDTISELPDGCNVIASTKDVRIAAYNISNEETFGLQFHPEVYHSVDGKSILKNFLLDICECSQDWSPDSFIEHTVKDLRKKLTKDKVVLGLSGGVDSTVAAVLLQKAIGDNLFCIFVDNGLLRKNEFKLVLNQYNKMNLNVQGINAKDNFYKALKGVADPEKKRKIIGKIFIDVFEDISSKIKNVAWLGQGTIYPDVIESVSATGGPSATIKSHHNVGGLPSHMKLKVIEPLNTLFKDEVRKIGQSLGINQEILGRHPFPGPGLGIRILGNVTKEKVRILQDVDDIFISLLKQRNLYDSIWQAGAIFLDVQSVGVMGDERTYENVIALRSVGSTDGMTADWTHLPYEFLAEVSSKIINKVKGVNRVVYDISSKPPATIEWE